jgi:hypothetical protein
MERELVSEEELISILNSKLSEYDECKECSFEGILKLAEEDKDGCNWSNANVRCSGVAMEICLQFAERISFEAKQKYNIKR